MGEKEKYLPAEISANKHKDQKPINYTRAETDGRQAGPMSERDNN